MISPVAELDTSVSRGLSLSLRASSSAPPASSIRSEDRACSTGSPYEVLGPFSTSSREDPPTRVSTPAAFRLRRWSGLDGLLPSRPCRLVSSGGTLGVPRRPAMNPAPPRGRRTVVQLPVDQLFVLGEPRRPAEASRQCLRPPGPVSAGSTRRSNRRRPCLTSAPRRPEGLSGSLHAEPESTLLATTEAVATSWKG